MRIPSLRSLDAVLLATALLAGAPAATAQSRSVANTPHNLSLTGPGEIRAAAETQVCKFCHVPHSAVVAEPLWGHALAAGQQYRTPATVQRGGQRVAAPQPDGASRLCLSCHDGTVALGDVAGEKQPIPMRGVQRLEPGRKGFLGTDLSGSHPISVVMSDAPSAPADDSDMALRPLSLVRTDRRVRLDPGGKLQCTTCHDPHDDRNYRPGQVPHFWVGATVEEVCLGCHAPR